MEIKILEQEKTRIVFELYGADHTLCSMLRDELWNDKDVSVSTYSIDHPLKGVPKFIVESKKDPMKALKEASARLQKKSKDVASQVK